MSDTRTTRSKTNDRARREHPGLDALARLRAAFAHLELGEDEADRLSLEIVRETRRERAQSAQADKEDR